MLTPRTIVFLVFLVTLAACSGSDRDGFSVSIADPVLTLSPGGSAKVEATLLATDEQIGDYFVLIGLSNDSVEVSFRPTWMMVDDIGTAEITFEITVQDMPMDDATTIFVIARGPDEALVVHTREVLLVTIE